MNIFRKPAARSSAPRRLVILLFAITAGFLAARNVYAIDPDRAMSQYVRDGWGTEQGFPKGPVYAIAQTSDGYLWIGTEAGLVRFDGRNFRLIKDDSGAFTVAGVLGLAADNDGCLWLRQQDLTIVRYCHGVFEHPAFSAGAYVNIYAMGRAANGEVLITRINDDSPGQPPGTLSAYAFRKGGFQKLDSASGLPNSAVISLTQTLNGDIWMGTREAGLFHFSGGRTSVIRNGLPDPKVNCVLPDGERNVWIGTDDGLVRWNGTEVSASGIPSTFRHFQALSLVRDRDGNVWVGTDAKGLLRLNSKGLSQLGASDTTWPQAITALFEDREGDLWIGHADGIERLRDSVFVTYSTAEGLPTDGGGPVFVDSMNRMWFPPSGGGLWWAQGEKHGQITADGLNHDTVYGLAASRNGMWIARQHGGLTKLSFEGDSFAVKTYRQADGLAQNSVYSAYESRDGTVWAGTLSGGVSMLRDGEFKNFTIDDGLAANAVTSILEGSDGTMWFATPGGLTTLSKGQWRTFSSRAGLASDNVDCLFEDSKHVLWVGTASGLSFGGLNGFRVPAKLPDALRARILGLAEDKYGWLWVATSEHVLRVKRDGLLNGTLAEGDIREYALTDGLRGLEGVKRHRSVITDSLGRVWFSLNRGISVVDPARLTRNSAPAIAHIESISADGTQLQWDGEVKVPSGHQRITFGYSGLSLAIPDRVRYRYRLEGFDKTWSDPTASREAVYTNIPPRRYQFRVMAANPDGVWSTQEAFVNFEVSPSFWQTWWFRLFIAVAIMGCILAIYRIRMGQLTRQINLRFQERLAERTRIAQELHDTLLQGFLSASMQVHIAADCVPDDSKAKPILIRSMELMHQVIEEGRNAVRGLRASNTDSLDLEHALSRIQNELGDVGQADEEVEFRVIVEGEQKPLHPVLRDEVYRIGREALINAFRHAKARNVELELRYSPSRLTMLVRDDGCGIDPAVLQAGRDGHWGLSGMRERAARIGASLHVMSNASAGTEIELSVPGNVAFRSEPNGKSGLLSKGKRGTDLPRRENGTSN